MHAWANVAYIIVTRIYSLQKQLSIKPSVCRPVSLLLQSEIYSEHFDIKLTFVYGASTKRSLPMTMGSRHVTAYMRATCNCRLDRIIMSYWVMIKSTNGHRSNRSSEPGQDSKQLSRTNLQVQQAPWEQTQIKIQRYGSFARRLPNVVSMQK